MAGDESKKYLIVDAWKETDESDIHRCVISSTWCRLNQQVFFWPPKLDKLGLYKSTRKHQLPDEETWEMYNMKLKKSFDDLDKAYAALELYFQSIELSELGKRPPPENSDIASEIEEINTRRRERKQRQMYSPPSTPKKKKNKISESGQGTKKNDDTKKDDLTVVVSVPTPPINLNILSSSSSVAANKGKGKSFVKPAVREMMSKSIDTSIPTDSDNDLDSRSDDLPPKLGSDDHLWQGPSSSSVAANKGKGKSLVSKSIDTSIPTDTDSEHEPKRAENPKHTNPARTKKINERSAQVTSAGKQDNQSGRALALLNYKQGNQVEEKQITRRQNECCSAEIVRILKSQQKQINALSRGDRNVDINDNDDIFDELLPLKTFPMYVQFQEKLKDRDFQCAFENFIKGIGGADLKQIVRNSLTRIFSNKVGKDLNWEGGRRNDRAQKNKFGGTQLQLSFFRAVTSMKSSITDFEVKKVVVKWLSQCPEKFRDEEKKAARRVD